LQRGIHFFGIENLHQLDRILDIGEARHDRLRAPAAPHERV
jgi:hypothetical protein